VAIPVVLPVAYSVIFILFLLVKYRPIRKIIRFSFYEGPKKAIELVSDFEINNKKILLVLLPIQLIISLLTSFLILVFTVGDVMKLLPIVSNYFTVSEVLAKEIIAKFLADKIGSNVFVFLGIGAFWIFLLRQIRLQERKNKIEKYRGSRVLIIYLYSVLGLIITKISVTPFPEVVNVYGEEHTPILILFAFVSGFSIIATFFVYFLERYVISRFWTEQT